MGPLPILLDIAFTRGTCTHVHIGQLLCVTYMQVKLHHVYQLGLRPRGAGRREERPRVLGKERPCVLVHEWMWKFICLKLLHQTTRISYPQSYQYAYIHVHVHVHVDRHVTESLTRLVCVYLDTKYYDICTIN